MIISMKSINKNIVKIKNLMGIIDNPIPEDLLFEIVQFLDNTQRYDGEFTKREVSLFTRIRIKKELNGDLGQLIKMGYLKKLKYSSYKVIKHLWEKS